MILIMERRTYYFRTSWWFVFGFWGSLCIWGATSLLGEISIQTQTSLLEKLGFVAFVIMFIVLGIWAIAILFTSKIILSPDGVEYHTLGAVIKARWQDVKVPIRPGATDGNFSLYASKPEIRLRSWTRFAPWDAQKGSTYNLAHDGIPIYQFGGINPQKMIADIHHFFKTQAR